MNKSIFCLVRSSKQANVLVDCLLKDGIAKEEISILCPNLIQNEKGAGKDFDAQKGANSKTEKYAKASEYGVAGTTASGTLSGSLGLLAGVGALSIPGIGSFIAAGPFKSKLSGSAAGGGLGYLVETFVSAGVPEFEAKKYETALKQGNILICVRAHNDQEITRATEVLKNNGGEVVSTTREKTKSSY
jgi:hypothetical protein